MTSIARPHHPVRRWALALSAAVMSAGALVAVGVPVHATPVPAQAASGTYTVIAGDYLYGIARKTNTPINTLLSLNGLTLTSTIHPGQVLKIAAGATTPSPTPIAPAAGTGTYTVVAGDYLYGIARKTNTPINTLLSLNGLSLTSMIRPGQVLKVAAGSTSTPTPTPAPTPAPPTSTYTVRSGDTLYGIASKTGTPIDTLLSLNGLTLRSLILPGQVLKVTGGSSTPAPAQPGLTADPNCTPSQVVPASANVVVDVRSSGSSATVRLLRRSATGWTCDGGAMAGRVGRNGVRPLAQRIAGDGTTPGGAFELGTMTAPNGDVFQFFGNGSNPGVPGAWHQVRSGDCWWTTPGTSAYNTLVNTTAARCTGDNEYLPNYQNSYNRAALIGANMGPSRSGDAPGETARAGAIFLHNMSYNADGSSRPTSGCVSLGSSDLTRVLRALTPGQTYFAIS